MYDLSQELKNKVISVTGGSGYIGSSLLGKLSKYPAKKIIRISRKKLESQDNIEDWILDLSDYKSWLKLVEVSDIIFHLSGNTSIKVAEDNPIESLISETLPIDNLVKASHVLNRKPRVIYASTATIYGLTHNFPVSETYTPFPITSYDLNKFESEKKLEIASRNNLINSISLRLANVYGPSPIESSAIDRGILSQITKLSFENKIVSLYGSGNYLRDYVYIDDVVNALLLSSVANYAGIRKSSRIAFNVSTGVGTYLKTVFEMIIKEVEGYTGKKLKLRSVPWPREVSEIEKRNFIGSAERLKSLTGWSAKTSIKDGVHLLVDYYSKELM